MNQAEAQRLFKEANCFWFGEGRYNKVLPLYREALKHDPTDPVILYQLANVLWGFEKFDEMTEVLELAQQHQERLSDRGKIMTGLVLGCWKLLPTIHLTLLLL